MQEKFETTIEAGMMPSQISRNFNFSKLQAVLCIAASALLSGTLIILALQALF